MSRAKSVKTIDATNVISGSALFDLKTKIKRNLEVRVALADCPPGERQ